MPMYAKYSLILLLASYLFACNSQPIRSEVQTPQEDINALVANSLAYAQRDALPLARSTIERALINDPQHVAANNVAGLIYGRMREHDLAVLHFNTALASAPEDYSTLNNYANYLCDSGDKSSAIELFLSAAANNSNPNQEIAYTNAGLCAMRIPDTSAAAEYFIRALSVQADNQIALFQLAKINYRYQLGEQALDYLLRYARENSHTPETLKLGIQISRLNNNQALADNYLSMLQNQFPDSAQYQWALSKRQQ